MQGKKIIIEPMLEDPFEVFESVLKDFKYSREERADAERKLLGEVDTQCPY